MINASQYNAAKQSLQKDCNGKYIIIGQNSPGITIFSDNNCNCITYALTSDKWHVIPNGTTLNDIHFIPSFETYCCKWAPRFFDVWQLHKECLATNKKYAAYWKLYCMQQYKREHHVDLMTEYENALPFVSMKQLSEMRYNCTYDNNVLQTHTIQGTNCTHIVTLNTKTMEAKCDCKGYMFRHSCKHITQVLSGKI